MTSPRRLILASTSIYRRELLSRLIADFQCIAPAVDESDYQETIRDPFQLASTLACRKAAEVHHRHPDSVVIGADQVVDLQGQTMGKPQERNQAIRQLEQMSGKLHRLVTAVCVLDNQREELLVNETQLQMRLLTSEEIHRYVDREQPFDCAGSYRIESAGIGLFDHIQCDDFTAIIGLPLLALARELRCRGYTIP